MKIRNNLPYCAVIFTSELSEDSNGNYEKAQQMEELAKKQDGFLGMDSARSELGITISYWKSMEAVTAWKNNIQHTKAKKQGIKQWYKSDQLPICSVEQGYSTKFKNRI